MPCSPPTRGWSEPDDLCAAGWDTALATAPAPPLFPGALEGLEAIKEAGFATGLVTLQDQARLSWLLPPRLADLLEVTVCRGDAKPKPSPDGLRLALDRLGADCSEAVFLGDSVSDIVGARAAGVTALGAAWGYAGPAALKAAGAAAVLDTPALIGPGLLKAPAGTPSLRVAPSTR